MPNKILVPDYQGIASLAAKNGQGIIAEVQKLRPDDELLAILNGDDPQRLRAIASSGTLLGVKRIVHVHGGGLVGALICGYEHFLERASDKDIVVRLDAEEHDPRYIGSLAESARVHGASVGDLDFSSGNHMDPESYEYRIHHDIFPSMYEVQTGGKLRLSCAHGFQAYRADVLTVALQHAFDIIRQVKSMSGVTMTWGLDAALAIGAVFHLASTGLSVPVLPIPATKDRNRPDAKIVEQYRQHLLLLKAAIKLGFV